LLKPLKILLADDSEDNQLLFTALLEKQGHEIIPASTGQEAFEMFKKQKFDMVFMDVQMPIMDGYTATRLIRAWEVENRESPTSIIAFTAHAFEKDFRKSLAAGCNDHIGKPFKKETLFAMIEKYSRWQLIP
jgi:CheY-like chemotaxis protein